MTIEAGKQYGVQRDYTIGFSAGSNTVALNYVLTYTDPDGNKQTDTEATQVTESTVIKVTGSASADQKTVDAGDKVQFTFSFKNEGNVAIENASLTAPPIDGGSVIGQAFSLSPGSSKEMTYTTKVNQTIEVKPKLSYTAGGTNKTLDLDSITVKVEKPAEAGISLTLKADKDTLNAGESAVLTATIANTGNVTLTGIALTDGNGKSVESSKSALGVGESATVNVTVNPTATQNYQYSVSAKDPEGGAVQATSNQLTINVADEPQPSSSATSSATASSAPSGASLSIVVDADAYTLKEAGEVTFHVTVTNSSDLLLNNVTVSEKTIGEIGSVSAMGKDSKTFDKTVNVDKTTDFVFEVTASQEDGTPVTVVTDPLTVTVEGSSGPGLGFLGILLIIIVIAIAGVGIALFIMHRKNKGTGGGKPGGKGPYNGGKESPRPLTTFRQKTFSQPVRRANRRRRPGRLPPKEKLNLEIEINFNLMYRRENI